MCVLAYVCLVEFNTCGPAARANRHYSERENRIDGHRPTKPLVCRTNQSQLGIGDEQCRYDPWTTGNGVEEAVRVSARRARVSAVCVSVS